MQLDSLLEEKKTAAVVKEKQQIDTTSKGAAAAGVGCGGNGNDLMNKTMSELRQELGVEPGLHSAASKLRMRCSFYKEKYSGGEAVD